MILLLTFYVGQRDTLPEEKPRKRRKQREPPVLQPGSGDDDEPLSKLQRANSPSSPPSPQYELVVPTSSSAAIPKPTGFVIKGIFLFMVF